MILLVSQNKKYRWEKLGGLPPKYNWYRLPIWHVARGFNKTAFSLYYMERRKKPLWPKVSDRWEAFIAYTWYLKYLKRLQG